MKYVIVPVGFAVLVIVLSVLNYYFGNGRAKNGKTYKENKRAKEVAPKIAAAQQMYDGIEAELQSLISRYQKGEWTIVMQIMDACERLLRCYNNDVYKSGIEITPDYMKKQNALFQQKLDWCLVAAKVEEQAQDIEKLKVICREIGDIYWGGLPYEDFKAAFDWYLKGAKLDEPKCCYKVGTYYYFGNYIPKDIIEAKRYLERALQLGYIDEHNMVLNDMYEAYKKYC